MTSTSTRPIPPQVNPESIPAELRERRRWVLWRYKWKPGRKGKPGGWTKVPHRITGGEAKSTDPATWSDFEHALKVYRAGKVKADGIGFVFDAGDGLVGVDLDDALDENGAPIGRAAEVLDALGETYIEVSPSGRGVKAWLRGDNPLDWRKRPVKWAEGSLGAVEVYHRGRYFTVTGQTFNGAPSSIGEFNGAADVLERMAGKRKRTTTEPRPRTTTPTLDDERIIEKAWAARNGEKFRRLFDDGDVGAYGGDGSSADMALADLIVFYTQDAAQVERILRASALVRPKWDRRGDDYLKRTIDKALAGVVNTYSGTSAADAAHPLRPRPATDDGAGPDVEDEPWPEPVPLDAHAGLPDFPIDRAFPDSAADLRAFVMAAAEADQVPVDAVAMAVLPVLTTCYARKFEVDAGGWVEPAPLWTLTVMESGERKSAMFSRLVRPLEGWEREQAERLGPEIATARAAREVLERRLRDAQAAAAKDYTGETRREVERLAAEVEAAEVPTVPALFTSDPTTEQIGVQLAANGERFAVLAPEGDAIRNALGRYSSGEARLGGWKESHAGDPYRVHRGNRPPVFLTRPALSVGIVLQPVALEAMLKSRDANGEGFCARFLMSTPRTRRGFRSMTPARMPAEVEARFGALVERLLNIEMPDEPVKVGLDPYAGEMFLKFRQTVEVGLRKGGELAETAAWGSKLPGAVARLALALHCAGAVGGGSVGSVRRIGGDEMAAALSWAEYLIAHERAARVGAGMDTTTRHVLRLVEWLREKGLDSFSQRDAHQRLRCADIQTTTDLEPVLRAAEDFGYIRRLPPPPKTPKGGRPSERFCVNPLLRGVLR